MYERRFSKWIAWRERRTAADISCPGVYVIARPGRDIAGRTFSWIEGIIYVGMTNAVSGLDGRLTQFDNTISRKRRAHGGADRVLFKHRNYGRLASSIVVSVAPFKCDPSSISARDLRALGEVARFEYLCLAEYAAKFKRLPQFNDKKRSPKFSRTVRDDG
jgi:hypothetical protein